MSTELVVIIPSRGRPESVKRMAVAFAETGALDVATVWSIEDNDPALDDYRREVAEHFPFGSVDAVNAGAMAPAINATALAVLDDLDPEAIAVLNDDHLPRTPEWHTHMLFALRQLGPVGMVYPDDGLQHERLSTVWAVTAQWVRTLRRMIPCRVGHLYGDNAMLNLAQTISRCVYLGHVLVEHMHPAAGKAETDEGYQRVNSRDQYRADRLVWQAWRNSQRRARQVDALRAAMR